MTEKLGVLLVDVPEPRFAVYHYIAYKCTEEEAKKYPQFRWVSLEDL